MELRVVGCHGGETPKHRTSAFLLNETICLDAGSITSGLDLDSQMRLQACIISHAHMDHVRDLASLADNRCLDDCGPLLVAGTAGTLRILRAHFFNNLLWPDFSVLPTPESPTIKYLEMLPEMPLEIAGLRVTAVPVSHTIESSALIVEDGNCTIAYTGDTGPTERLWDHLNKLANLRALIIEVSYPNDLQHVATVSGHHTPNTLSTDLNKFRCPEDLPTLLFHIKPTFQRQVEQECAKLKGFDLSVLEIGDQFVL